MNLPASCLAVGCGEVTAAFRAEVAADPASPITSVSCSGSGSCVCRFTFGPLATADAGTYTIPGGTLTMASTVNGYAKDFGVRSRLSKIRWL